MPIKEVRGSAPDIIGFVVVALLIGLPLGLYLPGIGGPFLLDDFYNLSGLNIFGGRDEIGVSAITHYLGSNASGVSGRPVAMLSFLLNDNYWPTSPSGFKYTNILLHIACGLSVFWLCILLCRIKKVSESLCIAIAGFTALLWVVHPINVSTTLYVVQRMTILMTLFGLWGLIAFVYAISERRSGLRIHALMILGFGGSGLLSLLSKENAVILPMLALLIYSYAANSIAKTHSTAKRYVYLLWLAPVIVASYLVIKWPDIMKGYQWREFELGERLLTETRVLVDYLFAIIVPPHVRSTLYFDDFLISSSLFEPITTFYASIAILIMAIIAVVSLATKKIVMVGFGVSWFFVGHFLESTFIPLEIAFEHRNYMPSIGVIFAVMGSLGLMAAKMQSIVIKRMLPGVMCVVVAYTSLLTSQYVSNWRSWPILMFTWAYHQPASVRAQMDFVEVVARNGQPFKALEILEDFSKSHGLSDLSVALRLDVMQCEYLNAVSQPVWLADRDSFNMRIGSTIGELERYIVQAKLGNCSEINPKSVRSTFEFVKDQKLVAKHRATRVMVLNLEAEFENSLGQVIKSLALLDEVALLQKTVDVPLKQAVFAWKAGELGLAKKYIQRAYKLDDQREFSWATRYEEISRLEQVVMNSTGDVGG